MLGSGFLPEGEVGGIALLALAVKLAGSGEELVDIASGELAVVVGAVVARHIEIYRSFALVGIAGIENLLDIFNLLDDVA